MMELSHSLILNEEALQQIPEPKRPVFIFEWLRFLDKVLVAAQKSDIKGCQKKLVEQLIKQIHESPGPPTRKLIGRCLATLFNVGDASLLFDSINKCNDTVRNKDDSPSFLQVKLAAISCLGTMYQHLGRMTGRSYEETVYILLKSLKNAESQTRCEVMIAMEKIVSGLGNAATSVHKDIFKALRHCLTDRVMTVRCSAAKCLQEMLKHSPFLYTSDLETVASLCFRAFEGSNYEVRCAISELLGIVMATTQQASHPTVGKNRLPTLEEVLNLMASGFLRGGIGFLKGSAGEMIKGGSSVSREIRVGVTHAYVVFIQKLGGIWLENNLNTILTHLLELVANPKAVPTHVDAVYSRKCINFILQSVLGRLLGEKAQASACKELVRIIIKHVNEDSSTETSGKDNSQDTALSQHVLVCSLQQLGSLISVLDTTASTIVCDPSAGIIESVVSVLVHSSSAARLAAAWCLRLITTSVPSQLTPLLERCSDRLDALKSSPEAIAGYSAALSALLGASRNTPLGIPQNRGKMIFNVAEDLLRSASQNSRLSLQRTQAGWLMIGSVMTLGSSVVKGLLPRMMLLWKNSFPRSNKELEQERHRGDAFTWQVTLEGRAGALAAMASFLLHCKDLVTDDVVRRLLSPIESALVMLVNVGHVFKSYGQHLKACAAMVRMRLYEVLSLLPPRSFEGTYNSLLRLLVAEFTLTENPANTTTSLLRSLCHANDSIILGFWLQDTDHKAIEDQLQPNSASGSGSLEHDHTALYKTLKKGEFIPDPLPLGVAVIDMSVILFGLVFPVVAYKHRLQMLDHFSECIRQAKATRQEAVQINIFTALLNALKALVETKSSLGSEDVRKAAIRLMLGSLNHTNPILRCAAGEALGRMAQVVGDGRFVAEMAQHMFDKLKTARDAASRTGHSLALGCLHRYVGGMGTGQHLNTSVSILLALAQDINAPIVQLWALHALSMIADSGGPMFRSYVEPTLSIVLKLLLHMAPTHIDVHQCIGKCLTALITTVGPELQGNSLSVCTTRSSFLVACAIMQDHSDPLVQAEAISCLQQLHMFAPRHVNLTNLVPTLCSALNSSHLLLRRASVACLRQLAQREASEISAHAISWTKENNLKPNATKDTLCENGLEGAIFCMLDTETDIRLVSDAHDTLTSMLQTLAEENVGHWLQLCKSVLTATELVLKPDKDDVNEIDNEADADDEARFKASDENSHTSVSPRWSTRVFAAESLQRIINTCEGKNVHFDLGLARESKIVNKKDCLVLHLSDLVRMAFMAATSDSDPLRIEGLKALEIIISKFSKIPEPEFPDHVILEQYQAQVGAALRPAFSPETPSHITAFACQVCSAWIGCGVARDLNDLRRVHQLLVSSLEKLHKGSSTLVYNESASTMEKLAILKAWAEVYVVAMNNKESENNKIENDANKDDQESLLRLVAPELSLLSIYWLAFLKDYALLSLPPEFRSQLPHEGGAFYSSDTMDTVRKFYKDTWPPVLNAATLWLCNGGFEETGKIGIADLPRNLHSYVVQPNKNIEEVNTDYFHLVFGICLEALCSPFSTSSVDYVMICLNSFIQLFSHPLPSKIIGQDSQLSTELANVLHRMLLTRESVESQLAVMKVTQLLITAHKSFVESERRKHLKELAPANQEPKDLNNELASLGEGGESGVITPEKSVVFSILENCLCLIVRQLPQISPSLATSTGTIVQNSKCTKIITEESALLILSALKVVVQLPTLCSYAASAGVASIALHLIVGVLKEITTEQVTSLQTFLQSTLECLRDLCSNSMIKNVASRKDWINLLQSGLAHLTHFSKSSMIPTDADELIAVLSINVYITSAPREVVCAPNLRQHCINTFKHALQQDGTVVQVKAISCLQSIFMHSDMVVVGPYIHALCPKLIELIGQFSNELSSNINFPDIKILAVKELIHTLKVLVDIAANDKKLLIVGLYIPALVSLLIDPDTSQVAPSSRNTVHQCALQQLMKIGPQYPQEFRTVVSKNIRLKNRLEACIRSAHMGSDMNRDNLSDSESRSSLRTSSPTIKLKTDFSNFTG
ncbi:HEAT repeat-containing protein 5B [Trichonephila inaurata madagascariensis]|uniref:HEAT repeat-containing protein 5A n=1 Tax=Trichonephila inaurata madagascariensis TaxID=2747483 RepID=A0A8X6X5N7_9ARAC|nr:HEAT repeat-containing protein 5B [Trichonephila inaurata madagascariensis]